MGFLGALTSNLNRILGLDITGSLGTTVEPPYYGAKKKVGRDHQGS